MRDRRDLRGHVGIGHGQEVCRDRPDTPVRVHDERARPDGPSDRPLLRPAQHRLTRIVQEADDRHGKVTGALACWGRPRVMPNRTDGCHPSDPISALCCVDSIVTDICHVPSCQFWNSSLVFGAFTNTTRRTFPRPPAQPQKRRRADVPVVPSPGTWGWIGPRRKAGVDVSGSILTKPLVRPPFRDRLAAAYRYGFLQAAGSLPPGRRLVRWSRADRLRSPVAPAPVYEPDDASAIPPPPADGPPPVPPPG